MRYVYSPKPMLLSFVNTSAPVPMRLVDRKENFKTDRIYSMYVLFIYQI